VAICFFGMVCATIAPNITKKTAMENELRYFIQTRSGRTLAAFAEWPPAIAYMLSNAGTWSIRTADDGLLCDPMDLPQSAEKLKALVDHREAAHNNTAPR
jgi:hypothetical protein